MKLAIITFSDSPTGLARSYRVRSIAQNASLLGHDIKLISPANAEEKSAHYTTISVPYSPTSTHSLVAKIGLRLIYLPDPQRRWVKPLLRNWNQIIENDKPDALIVSTPPHSIQLAGIKLAKKYNILYYPDLRDDWLQNNRQRWITSLHRYYAAKLESLMVQNAKKIILNTEIVKERFVRRYKNNERKFSVVTNGYNETDFCNKEIILPEKCHGRKILAYTGGFYGNFLYKKFTNLANYLANRYECNDWILLTAGTNVEPPPEAKNTWINLGSLPPSSTATLMRKADLLLAAMPPGEREPSGTVPLKLYSYLRSGSPILYLGEAGSPTELLNKFPGTFCKDRSFWPCVGPWICNKLFDRHYERPGIEEYSFEKLTRNLLLLIQDSLQGVNTVIP